MKEKGDRSKKTKIVKSLTYLDISIIFFFGGGAYEISAPPNLVSEYTARLEKCTLFKTILYDLKKN